MKTIALTSTLLRAAALLAILTGFLACGGGSSPNVGTASTLAASATSVATLVHTVSTASGYQLVRDGSSTHTHLVFDLLGPTVNQIGGMVFNFNTGPSKTTWGNPGGSDPYIKEGQVLSLGTGTRLLKSQLSGSTLQSAIFQKGSVAAATLGSQPILSVALELKVGASTGAVSLSSTSAQILYATGTTQAITVAVGSLTAQ